jgi:nitroreductase
MDFSKLAKERYSVRKFSERPVEDEKLAAILEAGKLAPTAKNIQPQTVYVLRGEQALAAVDRSTKCRYGAGTVLLVCSDREKAWVNPFDSSYDSVDIDAAIVADEMILQAWDIGIGSCWVAWFDPAVIIQELSLPENLKPVIMIPVGYAAEDARPSVNHDRRKNIDELIKIL